MYRMNPWLFAILFILVGCGKNPVSFVDAEVSLSSTAEPVCTISEVKRPLRVVFMIDNSGSTLTYDPSKYYRITAINNFLTKYASNSLLTYNINYFSGVLAWSYDFKTSGFAIAATQPFSNATGAVKAINAYDNVVANGGTPYGAAFTGLSRVLTADAAGTADYSVIFLSDGAPTDFSAPLASKSAAYVTNLVAQAKSMGKNLNFSTVYFGPNNDTTAQGVLAAMASAGNGQYVNSNSSFDIKIDEVLKVTNCK